MQKFGREETAGNVVKNKLLLFALFVFIVVSDQFSKFIVDTTFHLNESKSIIGNILYLRYIKNPGAAFGLSFGHPHVMLTVTILITVILGYLFLSGKLFTDNKTGEIAMVLVLGGAVGNLIDRIRMREVVDFIDMGIGSYRWPVYNLADIYVTVGMFIMIYIYTFKQSSLKT